MTANVALRDRLAVRRQTGGEGGPTIFDLIQTPQQRAQIARALPKHLDVDRFLRIVTTEVKRTPKLLECTPMSLLGAMMLSAQLGLEPGPLGHAYLVPFRNGRSGQHEVTLIIGYRGLIDLARRSGQVVSIVAREVCEHDEFAFEYGLDEKLIHRPRLTDRGHTIAYYGVAKLRDGGHVLHVMSRDDIDKRRSRSKAGVDGPWQTDYDAMSRKTVIRAMAPWLPVSIEFAQAVAADEQIVTTPFVPVEELLTFTPPALTDEAPADDSVPPAAVVEASADAAESAPSAPGEGEAPVTSAEASAGGITATRARLQARRQALLDRGVDVRARWKAAGLPALSTLDLDLARDADRLITDLETEVAESEKPF